MKISVIIPVYNVCDWLDACLESIVNQTYTDFEVILVNDGSTDGSDKKCQSWAAKDNRIRYFSKSNEGLSPTRNYGVEKAQGEYFLFVDSDDWLDQTCLEKLIQKAEETGADIVECDIYKYNDTNGKVTPRICYGAIDLELSKKERMMYGYTAIWKCLIKRQFYQKYNMAFPNCHSPARAVYAALIALSNQVVCVREPLYYYRTFRKGSLTDKPKKENKADDAIGVAAFDYLINEFERLDIRKTYENELERTVKYKLSDLLAAFFHRKEEADFKKMSTAYYKFIADKFPDSKNDRYLTLGGYNLNQIVWYTNLIHNPYCRFNFSSLISIMNPIDKSIECTHTNRYREIMLHRELQNKFWEILKEEAPKYLFLDFVEERHNLLSCGSGFLTASDAFEGSKHDLGDYEIIERFTEKCEVLWKDSALQFIERMRTEFPQVKIVLVKNFLSEKVGNIKEQAEYKEILEIRRYNEMLHRYYEFFELNSEELIVIEASKCNHYFTDKQYEYGAVPSHLNAMVNMEIANEIEKYL